MTAPVTWSPSATRALERLDGKLFATTTEAAVVLRYDVRTLRKAIESGDIPATRVGTGWRVPVAWLLRQTQLDTDGNVDAG